MKYDQETLKAAIFFLMLHFKKAEDNGIHMHVPSMLSSIADDQFIKVLDKDYDPSYDEMVAIRICQEAMKDLHDHGQFNFGEKTYDFIK